MAVVNLNQEAKLAEEGFVIPGTTQEDYDKAGSKFANPGLHEAVFGMPEWKTVGRSIGFPFTIDEPGPDNEKTGEITCGVSKDALWKLKEVLEALGVPTSKTAKGELSFDNLAVPGKRALTLWTKQKDSRSPEEGGKGTEYTKPVSVYPLGTTAESLGL